MNRLTKAMLMVGIAIAIGVATVYADSLLTATSGQDWVWFDAGDGYIFFGESATIGANGPEDAGATINYFASDDSLELIAQGDVVIESTGGDVRMVVGQ